MNRFKPSVLRFIEKVNTEGPAGCWLWKGSIRCRKNGYGSFVIIRGKHKQTVGAHRYSYERFVGPIPSDMYVCHTCDNPLCVNPRHLFLGTVAENNADMKAKSRHARGEKINTAKLTEGQVRAILTDPRPLGEVSKAYGICPQSVWKIRKRQSWKHVTQCSTESQSPPG